tara:strand:+ start:576 stop:1049 length:474 start_codon:yes stop_codon:yes gene_type:complete
MSQNLVSLSLTDADYAEIDAALAVLERHFKSLIDLSIAERRSLTKMGDKSEAFCRQALRVLDQNRQVLPPTLDLAEAQRDLAQLDALSSRAVRIDVLQGKVDDSIIALGSDIMSAALEGYALLRVVGEGSGLEHLRQDMSARFSRRSAAPKEAVAKA